MSRELAALSGVNQRVLRAYHAAVRRYARKRWVTGVAIGLKETDGRLIRDSPVIIINVRKKVPMGRVPVRHRVPKTILGVPTDVVEFNLKPSSAAGSMPQAPQEPLAPGSSIGRQVGGTAGTLGAIVRRSGTRMLLTAAHVLDEGGAKKKASLTHPGPADALATDPPISVANVEATHIGADAGIARLVPQTRLAVNRTLGNGRQILPPAMPALGDVLEKRGRTTHTTRAVVQAWSTVGLPFPAMFLLAEDGETNPISADGDSGAIWYDVTTGAAKGLHVGVSAGDSSRAMATRVNYIVEKLKLSWE